MDLIRATSAFSSNKKNLIFFKGESKEDPDGHADVRRPSGLRRRRESETSGGRGPRRRQDAKVGHHQGTLTEGKGTVQFDLLVKQACFVKKKIMFSISKVDDLN